ncbi:hypothetical protein ACFLTN_01300 [Chloroflexota bacterium]
MLGQFLATFAGVILSFLLWFGGEKIFQHQREKKARAHLYKEIVEEIEENIDFLGLLANLIEENLKAGKVPVFGIKLNISARSSAISSGELRLISDPEQQKLVRNSAYNCGEFNHFIENTELFLAIINLKAQPRALPQAKFRLAQLKENARETATYLRDVVRKLTSSRPVRNPGTKKGVMREFYVRSYAASIMVLVSLSLVVLKNQWRSTEGYIVITLISLMVLFFGLSIFSICYQNKRRNRLMKKLAAFAFDLKIGRLSLYLGFVALIIALIQYGYPWGLLVATLLVIAVDVFLFWRTPQKWKKITSAQRDNKT